MFVGRFIERMPDLESDLSKLFWDNPWFQTRMFPVGQSFHKSKEENLALLSDLMPDVPWDEIPQHYRLELWRAMIIRAFDLKDIFYCKSIYWRAMKEKYMHYRAVPEFFQRDIVYREMDELEVLFCLFEKQRTPGLDADDAHRSHLEKVEMLRNWIRARKEGMYSEFTSLRFGWESLPKESIDEVFEELSTPEIQKENWVERHLDSLLGDVKSTKPKP